MQQLYIMISVTTKADVSSWHVSWTVGPRKGSAEDSFCPTVAMLIRLPPEHRHLLRVSYILVLHVMHTVCVHMTGTLSTVRLTCYVRKDLQI